MGFKFLQNKTEQEIYGENYVIEPTSDYCQHYRSIRRRDEITSPEWEHILRSERQKLIETIWRHEGVSHTIIDQDNGGFIMRTELRF